MLIYNVPASMLNDYKNRNVTIRSNDTRSLAEGFSSVPRENLYSLQILSTECDPDPLLRLPDSVPVDLVIDHPTAQYSRLYQFAELPRKHSARVTTPAAAGMTKVIKVAQALNFSVKLEFSQPGPELMDEFLALAQYYLRGPTVSSPVEPFHSLFLSFFSGGATNLWSLQEEDPSVDRYVTDDGAAALSKRLVSLALPEDQLDNFVAQHIARCLETNECASCDFVSRCKGYFKLPDESYRCDSIKPLLQLLKDAAAEMKQDYERFVEVHGSNSPVAEGSAPSLDSGTGSDASHTRDCSGADETPGPAKEPRSAFSMRRLDLRLEEFTRHTWTSEEARVVWAPRISRICACLAEVEWRSIVEGVRACALTSVHPPDLERFSAALSQYGLTVIPLEKVPAQDGYVSFGRSLRDGEPFDHRCAIGRPPDAEALKSAYLNRDDEIVGRLLGYPSCCTRFFKEVWVEEGFIDTTWPMAHNTSTKARVGSNSLEIVGASSCNMLLRWLGPRSVFHLPCSFHCGPTMELADSFAEIAREAGYKEEMNWLDEMLNWPIEWVAHNGLAEITTPVGAISTVTDSTAENYRVSYKGAGFVKTGNLSQRDVGVLQGPGDSVSSQDPQEDTANSVPLLMTVLAAQDWYYRDNGFRSKDAMDLCHDPIVKLAAEALPHGSGNILDLGCGNGVLLSKLCLSRGHLIPWGVDACEEKIAHARMLMPEYAQNFFVSDIFDEHAEWWEGREFSLAILMIGRLNEVAPSRADALLERLRRHAVRLLVYTYDEDRGSIEELARKTTVELSNKRVGKNVAMARLRGPGI